MKRRKLDMFFISINLFGYDGKLPRYVQSSAVNAYLKKVRFKSRIPISEWEKAKPLMEMFFKRKLYAIENYKEDVTITDIYLIQETLPNFIEWHDEFMQAGRKFAIGEGYRGQVIWDAATLAHGLIAGSTGSGKTALLRCIIHQAIQKKFNVNVLDFKGSGDYAGLEREARKYRDLEDSDYGRFVISEPERARELLLELTVEVKGRLNCFKEASVSNIDEYNARGQEQFIPWLIVIDEAAQILDVKPKDKAEKELYADIDQYLRTLARMSRAAGVHILMGFIRPSSEVLDGQIKNNLLWRVCGYFADPAASRIVLDNDRATELPPEIKGRFIIGEDEVQAYYLPIPSTTVENGD
jgi:S-DNA-T family DNA segregation ATPase FtsK/SpoIIIE